MKTIILVLLVFSVIFIVFQSFMVVSTKNTEEQNYSVILKEKDFEIRFYPEATLATINSDAKTYKELSSPGFRKLAGYIFGGNEDGTQISMTAPVHMTIGDSVSTMSFVMPKSYNEKNLPKPNDPNVKLERSKEEYVAVLQFGGFVSDKDLKFYSEKLQGILNEKGITSYGYFRFLGYNPPYQLVGRKNEIIVSVDWQKK